MHFSERSGTEGPRHDPYGYEELIVDLGTERVVLHQGLGEWLERRMSDGTRIQITDDIHAEFAKIVGYTVTQCKRLMRKIEQAHARPHRAHGGAEWKSGYPGEELLLCKCGAILSSSFNIASIE